MDTAMRITTDDRFARVTQPEANKTGTRLVDLDRALDIRLFQIDLAELQARYGLRLEPDYHALEIHDERRVMPKGYTFSAIIREDRTLEIAEYVAEF